MICENVTVGFMKGMGNGTIIYIEEVCRMNLADILILFGVIMSVGLIVLACFIEFSK